MAFWAAGLQVQQAPSLDAISDFNALYNEGPSSNQLLRPEGVEKRPPSNIGLLRTRSISLSTQSNPLVQDFFDLIYSRMTGRVYQRPTFLLSRLCSIGLRRSFL